MGNKRSENQKKALQERRRKIYEAERGKKKAINRKISRIALIVVLTLAIIAGACLSVFAVMNNTGYYLRRTTALSTEHFKVDSAMLAYYMKSSYDAFLSYYQKQYGDYFSYYFNIDTTKPLRGQDSSNYDGTWFEYFEDQARTTIKNLLIVNEAAYSAGFKLSDTDLEIIDRKLDGIKPSSFGKGLSKADIRRCLILELTADKYELVFRKGLEDKITEDTLNTYLENNKRDFMYVSFMSYVISYDDSNSEKYTKAQAEEKANALAAAATSANNFTVWVTNNEDDADAITKSDSAAFNKTDDVSQWMFNADRKLMDTNVIHDESGKKFTVYLLTSLPAYKEDRTVSVSHILLSSGTYGTDAAAKEKADELYAFWKENGASTDVFSTLAMIYSDDTGSGYIGGNYDAVYEGQMTDEFNDWCFDESRQPGDNEIVQTTFGYHIMYFVGESDTHYMEDVFDSVFSADYDKAYAALEELYPVTVNTSASDKISM